MGKLAGKAGLIAFVVLALDACSVKMRTHASRFYPKASEDANIVYQLQSNKQRTHFYIDGKEMGVGRRLKVRINNQAHTIVAQPEGCIYKEEFVQPPYNSRAPLSFTFLIGECGERYGTGKPSPTKAPIVHNTINVTLDTTPPKIQITSYKARGYQSSATVRQEKAVLSGRVTDDSGISELRINGRIAALDAKGAFSETMPLTIGRNLFTLTAKDIHGNESVARLTLERKKTAEKLVALPLREKRTALVIGNAEYKRLGKLKNPGNDARDIAAALEQTGFDVELLLDANQEQMEEAIRNFGRKLAGGGVGLFYYAGHGLQVNGENYLIPVGAKIERQKDVRYKAVNVGQILDEMDYARNGLNIVILDACRNNPLPRGFRSAFRGLAKMEGPRGTIIAFATSPGSVALDGSGRNGIYTKHLLENITAPKLTVEETFKRVLRGVYEETKGKQVPWMSSSFTGEFYFVPK